MSVRVQCPSCGGPVVFEVGSAMVAVCPYCRSAVARGDRSVEDLGKVAELVETGAVLRLGLEGKFEGRKFRLTGRTQLQHEAGGVWDEWYASFGNDQWGWLSEAQGRFYMLFGQGDHDDLPEFRDLGPGEEVYLNEESTRFVVAETGTATARGAEGEIPYRLVPGSTYLFADLSGPDGEFATLDYSEVPPALYIGKEITLDDLGIPENIRREIFELREVKAKKINCPNCGGPLDLQAPDKTERVGCPFCGSLLDATQGNLTLLEALKEPPFEMIIPLGSKGTFGEDTRTVIGAVERSVTVDGVDYFWQEYLLYDARDGFEWLVRSDNHWSKVKGVPIGRVDEGKSSARYKGFDFRLFQAGTATVRGVIGECYWKVAIGEKAYAQDFIKPPYMLSSESSQAGTTQEINWSFGKYLTPAEVQKAFNLEKPLPAPKGVAPNQPFLYSGIYKYGLLFFGLLCLLGLVMLIVSPSRKVYEQTFTLRNLATPPVVQPGQANPALERYEVFFTDKFELKSRRNVKVTVSCPQLNGWLAAEGDLVEDATGKVQPFFIPLTHYAGVEDGEAWTEGENEKSEYLSAQPGGTYSVKLEVEKEQAALSGPLILRIEQGSASGFTWFLTLIAVGALPIGVGVYHLIFNSTRWSNSSIEPPEEPEYDETAQPEPPPAIDEPLPMAEEAGDAPPPLPVARPVARPIKRQKKKKRPRDDEDDED
jgi:hypothetical protein